MQKPGDSSEMAGKVAARRRLRQEQRDMLSALVENRDVSIRMFLISQLSTACHTYFRFFVILREWGKLGLMCFKIWERETMTYFRRCVNGSSLSFLEKWGWHFAVWFILQVDHPREQYNDALNLKEMAVAAKLQAENLDDMSRRYDFTTWADAVRSKYENPEDHIFSWEDFGKVC